MPNYSFVIDSSFRPFSFDEMLKPWVIYSNAAKEVEEKYDDLKTKADTFKYLANETTNDPTARAIYEGYANDLNAQAEDFARNGLSIRNRRALTSLKQRYQGEIGQLEEADKQLKELLKGRNTLSAAGKTILYGNENPKLSDFLGDGTGFNRYAIDTADLRTRGNNLGKAISSRMYSNDDAGSFLQGQYRIWRQTHGVQDIDSFMQSDAVQQAVDNELIANGAARNLSGRNLALAKQNILNGIYEGIIHEETLQLKDNQDYMSAKERASLAQSADATALNAALYGYKKNSAGQWVPDPELQNVKGKSGSSSSSSSSSGGTAKKGAGANKLTQSADRLRIKWKGNNPNDLNGDDDNDYDIETVDKTESSHSGKLVNYEQLPAYAKNIADEIIGDGDADLYQFYFQPYESGWNDTEAELEIVPRDIRDFKQPEVLDNSIFGSY